MDRHVRYVIVGIFVSVMLALGAVFLIWAAGTYDLRNFQHYTVYFQGSVSGLTEGSTVSYRGVEVGNVSAIRLAKERTDLVKVDIQIDEETPVRLSTEASLQPLGITGLSFISLTTDDNADMRPPEKIEGERYPVVRATRSQLDIIFGDVPQVTQKLLDLAGRLSSLLSDDNVRNLSETIVNVNKVSNGLNQVLSPENVESLSKAVADVSAASGALNRVLSPENTAQLSRTISSFSTASDDFSQAMTGLGQAAENIEQATNTIEGILRKNEGNIDRFTGAGIDEVMLLLRDSRKMVDSIRKLSDKLGEDPSRVIYQPGTEGVKVKK